MRFKVANYSRLEIRLDTLHIYRPIHLVAATTSVQMLVRHGHRRGQEYLLCVSETAWCEKLTACGAGRQRSAVEVDRATTSPILSCSGVDREYKEYNDVVSRCVEY